MRPPLALTVNDHHVYRGAGRAVARPRWDRRPQQRQHAHQHAGRAPLGWKIDPYGGTPRYDAVCRSSTSRAADVNTDGPLLKNLEVANLRGMGGAASRPSASGPRPRETGPVKFVVCNADESEPGTFKDRELIRRTPHLVIEGMILAGLVSARNGWLYIRHEYEEEIEVLEEAIDRRLRAGVFGDNILGSGLSFDLEVFVSPGGYVCGEELRSWRRSRTAAASRATSRRSRGHRPLRQADGH